MTVRERRGPVPLKAPSGPAPDPGGRLLPRSILGWFVLCWAVFLLGAVVVGGLLVSLYEQSTAERLRRAEAAVAHGCDAIAGRYRFLLAGPAGAPVPALDDPSLRQGLAAAVSLALRDLDGVEGGVWSAEAGPLAYAFPTYEGTGPKTDLPAAERPRLEEAALAAAAEQAAVARRYEARSQTLFVDACPLPATPIPGLAAWTMTRVATAGGDAYLSALLGLGVLLAALAGSAALLGRLLLGWSRRLRRLEAALAAADADLPRLARTGQRDLDRVVDAVNRAGERLAAARRESASLAQAAAENERLASLGRVAAGVAHEIRNPLAAMRLKAENALATGDPERRERALRAVLGQVARLDRLLRDLLGSVQAAAPALVPVDVAALLAGRAELFREQAAAAGLALGVDAPPGLSAVLDPGRAARALDNLVLNAIQNTPPGGSVTLAARCQGGRLLLEVADTGRGVPDAIRPNLFEPFVSGRPEGTGLGLALVREAALAHGGTARAVHRPDGTTFVLELPWRES